MPGIPRSDGALVRHRQQSPDAAGDGILRHRRVSVVTELVEARIAEPQAQVARVAQVLGHVVTEDLERALDARAGRDRRLCRTAEVRVVEVDQPVRRRAHLAALAQLLPALTLVSLAPMSTSIALMASPSRMTTRCTPRTSRALARCQPPGSADQRHRGLVARADDLQSRGTPGSVSVPLREERAAPDGGELLARPGRETVGQVRGSGRRRASSRPVWRARVSPPSSDAHEIVVGCDGSRGRDRRRLRCEPRRARRGPCARGDRAAGCRVRLNRDPARDEVQTASEPENGREFRRPHRGLADLDSR